MHWMHIEYRRFHRSFCVLVWITSGLYVFLYTGGAGSLLTLKALLYFLGGVVEASLVLAIFGAWMHKALIQALLIALRPPGVAPMGVLRLAGVAVLLVEGIAIYKVAMWAFAHNWAA